MRFLCLVYQEEEKLAGLSQDQMDSLVEDVHWLGRGT